MVPTHRIAATRRDTHADKTPCHQRAALNRARPLQMTGTVAAWNWTAVLAYAAGMVVKNAWMTKIAAAAAHVSTAPLPKLAAWDWVPM